MFNRMRQDRFITIVMVVLIAFGGSCANEKDISSVVTMNDQAILSKRVEYKNERITIEYPTAYQKSRQKTQVGTSDNLTLTLIAEVQAPSYDGTTLQASEVKIKGNKVYVGYNVKGEVFLGAVEVFDISHPDKPILESSAIFPNMDVNGIAIRDNDLFIAAAASDSNLAYPAVLDVMRLHGGQLSEEIIRIPLESYAATDVDIAGENVFVTSGAANGKTTIYNATKLEKTITHNTDDARGVDADANQVAVVSGISDTQLTSAKLYLFDKDAGSLVSSFDLNGATIPYSKSTIELKNGKAVLGLGDGGAQIVCLENGTIIDSIPPPQVAGLDASVTVTNAVSAYKNAIFISNGEAGVYMALTDTNFATPGCKVENLRIVGKLMLGDFQSANHVVFRNNVLFVAGGAGGLKIITVDLANDFVDVDDEL